MAERRILQQSGGTHSNHAPYMRVCLSRKKPVTFDFFFRLSGGLHVPARLPLDMNTCNLILSTITKICQKIQIV